MPLLAKLCVSGLGVLTLTVSRIFGPILCISALLPSPDALHRASESALICSKSTANLLSQAECQHALTILFKKPSKESHHKETKHSGHDPEGLPRIQRLGGIAQEVVEEPAG